MSKDCVYFGDDVPFKIKKRKRLDLTKAWHYCDHPTLPLGMAEVNPCVGCCDPEKCSGYVRKSDVVVEDDE